MAKGNRKRTNKSVNSIKARHGRAAKVKRIARPKAKAKIKVRAKAKIKAKPAKKHTQKITKKAVRKPAITKRALAVSRDRKKKAAQKVRVKARAEEKRTVDKGKLNELIARGRGRGFITDTEVLQYFPTIEDDIAFLEEIYNELEKSNIKVIETSQLIDVPKEMDVSVKGLEMDGHMAGAALDAVQSYLKEIGREALLKSEDERELAKRIEKGDEEARRQFIKANLRLVVSMA